MKRPTLSHFVLCLLSLLPLVFPLVYSYMLPPFSTLQSSYPGDEKYGGSFTDKDVLDATKLSYHLLLNNDTCALRMSTVLNLISGHEITTSETGAANGTGGMYYFYDTGALIGYLKKTYGVPLRMRVKRNSSLPLFPFRGFKGIMFVNISRAEMPDHCPILLWDGLGFYQGKGVVGHRNFDTAVLWEAPSGDCSIDLTIKQQPSCFPAKSMVELDSGETIFIGHVAIGDKIKTYTGEGEVVFSLVVTFLDQMPEYKGYYYIITTDSNTHLSLSEAHLVFKTKPRVGSRGIYPVQSVHASQIRPGDYVLVHHSTGGLPLAEEVLAVSIAQKQGAYAPVTQEGTMIVDGIWVSCYADIVEHDLAHSLMAPLRTVYGLAPRVLGAGGKYVHKYLRGVLRPVGLKIFGKEKFFNEQQVDLIYERLE